MEIKDAIKEFVGQTDGCSVYEGYSGRGMFGKTCLGIVISEGFSYMEVLVKLTRYLDENDVDDLDLKLESPAIDSLGLDTILYFPRIDD
jgi:hypothetical protein